MILRRILVGALIGLVPTASMAITLSKVEVAMIDVDCLFDPNCTPRPVESFGDIVLPGGVGTGLLHTRTFAGEPGSPAAGLHTYQYRIDLTGTGGRACIDSYDVEFGRPSPLDYDGSGAPHDVYVVMSGGPGTVAPDIAQINANRISVHFYGGLCAGESSVFFGMTTKAAPSSIKPLISEMISGSIVDAVAFGPLIPLCFLRPDLNNDFSAAQRDVLDDLVLDFITVPVIDEHFTPGIHTTPFLLPWHRDYVGDLEDFLVAAGHPEFVPFPAWDASNPVPAEFQDVDSSCPLSIHPGHSCAALVDTTPNVARPGHLIRPDLCDYATRDELTSGGVDVSRPGLDGYHGTVHVVVSGAMGAFKSPAANIFWGHHANIDNIWREWECKCGSKIPPFYLELIPRDLITPCPPVPCWVGWWKLDDPHIFDPFELMPMTFQDSRGADNAGMPEGGPVPVVGMVGGALSFDGVDDLLRVPHHADLEIGMLDLSLDAWVKTMAAGMQPIVEKRDSTGRGFAMIIDDGKLTFEMSDSMGTLRAHPIAPDPAGSPGEAAAPGPHLADGMWHHVAVSVDRDNPFGGRLFVDGRVAMTFDPTGVQGDISNRSDLLIGRSSMSPQGAPPVSFMGEIDEVDLFRRALKPVEVHGIHAAGQTGKYGALVGVPPVRFREICTTQTGGEPGVKVTVPVTLDDGDGVAGFQVDVGFDPSVLTPMGVRLGADTAAAGGWRVDHAVIGAGMLRVLGHSSPPTGLGAGPREVALADFLISAGAPRGLSPLSLGQCVLGDSMGEAILCHLCPQPGGVFVRDASSFRFDPIASPVGVDAFDPLPFIVSVEALNSAGLRALSYNGVADMSVDRPPLCAGTLEPGMLGFTMGLGGPDTFEIACCPDPLLPATSTPIQIAAMDPTIGASGLSDEFLGVAKTDVDASGNATVLDVTRTVRLALNQSVPPSPPATFQKWAADVPDEHCMVDGRSDVLDVIRVRNRALGLPPLCGCDGPFHTGPLTSAATAPTSVSLVKTGPRRYLLTVQGAQDLAGLQLELQGANPRVKVTPWGLTAGQGWDVASQREKDGRLGVVAYSGSGPGVSGDGAVLRITGPRRLSLTQILVSDSEGRQIPVQ